MHHRTQQHGPSSIPADVAVDGLLALPGDGASQAVGGPKLLQLFPVMPLAVLVSPPVLDLTSSQPTTDIDIITSSHHRDWGWVRVRV